MAYQSYSTCRRSSLVLFANSALTPLTDKFVNHCVDPFQLSDEWNNFKERLNCESESEIWANEENVLHLRHWASLRGQTLCRTGIH